MSIESTNSDNLNPNIRCIVCNESEVELNHKFAPLLNGMGCEPHISDYLADKQMATDNGVPFDDQAWLANAQREAGNVIGLPSDDPIVSEG
jgi:hypothetical protein